MLVIRRKAGEAIRIGEDIEVTVAAVENGRVKLLITAPAEVAVMRKEVALTREENRRAAGALASRSLAEFHGLLGRAHNHPHPADMEIVRSRPGSSGRPAAPRQDAGESHNRM